MRKRSTLNVQLILLALTAGLIAFVFFKGKNNPTALIGESTFETEKVGVINFEEELSNTTGKLSEEELNLFYRISDSETSGFISAAIAWDSLGYPLLAAYHLELEAEKNPTEENYLKAADKYFEAQKVAIDTGMFNSIVKKSISLYKKVIELNPGNIDAKADLAVCYIEGSRDVMMGVGILREILELNPDHQKSLFYLGILSLQSGQHAKALERFEHLVSLQPDNPFHYYYLGQIHLALNNKTSAIGALEMYKSLVKSESLKQDADNLIIHIRNN